jgi:thiaminase
MPKKGPTHTPTREINYYYAKKICKMAGMWACVTSVNSQKNTLFKNIQGALPNRSENIQLHPQFLATLDVCTKIKKKKKTKPTNYYVQTFIVIKNKSVLV